MDTSNLDNLDLIADKIVLLIQEELKLEKEEHKMVSSIVYILCRLIGSFIYISVREESQEKILQIIMFQSKKFLDSIKEFEHKSSIN